MKPKLFFSLLIVFLALIGYQKYSEFAKLKSIDSYESCIAAKGSVIQESYPTTCVTRLGTKFTQTLNSLKIEETPATTPLNSPNQATNKLFTHTLMLEENGTLKKVSYSFEYPSNFTIMEQAAGTFALLAEPNNFDDIAYYIDERQVEINMSKESQQRTFLSENGQIRIICFKSYCTAPAYTQILSTFKFTN